MLGTCAGMIMLDRDHLGVLDILARRNAFGRQLHSFEADLDIDGVAGEPVHAVFIRAPWVAEHGPEVEVLASVDGHPVAIRQGNVLALSFHPELTGERRLHELLLGMVKRRAAQDGERSARTRALGVDEQIALERVPVDIKTVGVARRLFVDRLLLGRIVGIDAAREPRGQRGHDDPRRVGEHGQHQVVGQPGQRADGIQAQRAEHEPAQLGRGQ